MVACEECDASGSLSRACSLCGSKFCSDHRLPESHDCPGLESYQRSQEWFVDMEQEGLEGNEPEIRGEIGDDKGVIWECAGCDAEYGTNQSDCVKCGSAIFQPNIVSKEKELEVRPTTKRQQESEKQSPSQEQPDYNEKQDELDTELWRFEGGLIPRLQSFLGWGEKRSTTSIESEIFAIDSDDTIYRIRPNSSDSGKQFMTVKYIIKSENGSSLHLEKQGTRSYATEELNSRLPRIISKEGSVWWDRTELILTQI